MTEGDIRQTAFPGADGRALAGVIESPRGTPRAFALFAHCFSCTKDIRAAREIAKALRRRGFAVLRFDFAGLGASEGAFADTNFSSNVGDLVGAAEFLRREYEAPALLIGHSLGGAAAIVAATRIPEVKAVAVIGAPAEAAHVARRLGPGRETIEREGEAEVSLAGRPFVIRRQLLEDLARADVLGAAAALRRPLLILHAPRDAVVGVDNAAALFTAAKHPKSFVSLDDADHLLSDAGDAQYAAGVIAAWAERYVGAGAAAAADACAAVSASGFAAPAPAGGASAASVPGHALAVALSVDGHPFVIDAGEEEGGDGLGPNPTRTVEGALAACAVMTMTMYAQRKGLPLERAVVTVVRDAEGGGDAHLSRALLKTVRLEGPLDEAARARLLEIADRCPVHRMLTEGVTIRSRLESGQPAETLNDN